MKILLIGEYSNLHATLAEGLRQIGHIVTVVSDGNGWRNFRRDIDISRPSNSKKNGIKYMMKLMRLMPKLRGYDVVQLINPDFIWLKAERQKLFYQYLRKYNKRIFIGAFGYDWYWVDAGLNKKLFRYGDFNIGSKMRTEEPQVQALIKEWINTPKGEYCQMVMNDCDGIPTCLYEYQKCYSSYFPEKTQFIPLPIKEPDPIAKDENSDGRLVVFIGIDRLRMAYKGTDIMLKAAQDLQKQYNMLMKLVVAENVPFEEYQRMMNNADVILDQLYSYTPSMNSLLAMSKGIICVGGGEPENYQILGEDTLRPIINVQPSYESVYQELEALILHPELLQDLKEQSIAYVLKHHNYQQIARQYADFWVK